MNERIKAVRKKAGITQDKFAEILHVSKNYICLIETGRNTPGDRLISDICREFKVNEEWLRTGEGEMIPSESEDAQLFAWMGEQLAKGTTSPDFQTRTLDLLRQLKPEHWKALEEIAHMIYEAEKEHRGE